MLFILQTDLYGEDIIRQVVSAIEVVAKSDWSTEGAIKPILSYLAANLPAPGKYSENLFCDPMV